MPSNTLGGAVHLCSRAPSLRGPVFDNVSSVSVQDAGAVPSPAELLVIDRTRVGEVVVLSLTGEVDTATAPRLRDVVLAALNTRDAGPVVIDMTDVRFLSGTGLSALVEAHRAAERRGEPLRVVVDHARPVLRPLQLTGLDQVLTLFHYLPNALRGDPTPEGHDGDAGDVDAT